MALILSWGTCEPNRQWCRLSKLNLDHEHFDDMNGVYIIWSGVNVIRVGSGIIRNRLKEHRQNSDILAYPNLCVTWAKVHGNQMLCVEKYLADELKPLIGERFPSRTPIVVNLPW